MSLSPKVKPGGVVVLSEKSYPQYKGKTGIALQEMMPEWGCGQWVVMIDGKLHPYVISSEDMEIVK